MFTMRTLPNTVLSHTVNDEHFIILPFLLNVFNCRSLSLDKAATCKTFVCLLELPMRNEKEPEIQKYLEM